MKKTKISLALVSLFCATAFLAGCSKDGDNQDREVASMKISGIPTAYQVEDTINWSALKVVVSFKDSADKETYTGSQIQYDVTSDVAEATKVVVYTDGLHAQTTLTEGEYNIEAALKSNLTKKFDLGTIVVGKITDDKYTLDSFEVPQFVEDLATIKASTEAESSFKDTSDTFTVGTKNVFRFVPRASFELKGSQEHAKRYTNYEKVFTLKEIKSDSSKVDADVDDFSVVTDQSGIKFAESAVGKKFELTVSPKDDGFAQDSNGHPAIVSFQFQVKSGVNIYDAKQLGILNLSSVTMQKSAEATSHYIEHIGRASSDPEAGKKAHYYSEGISNPNGANRSFWDATTETYNFVDYVGLWRDYLEAEHVFDNPVFIDKNVDHYYDVKGVFLQNKVTLTTSDVPADYFVTKNERGNLSHYDDLTCFRDGATLYAPTIGVAEDENDRSQDLEVNGNYFMIDNQIPICKSYVSSSEEFHTYAITDNIFPGGACMFRFCGIEPEHSGVYFLKQEDVMKGAKAIVKNLNTMGTVDDIDSEDAVMSVTAMIAFKNTFVGAEYNNTIVKQYQIGFFPNYEVAGANTIEIAGNTVHYNTLVKNSKVFDCSNAGIFNYKNPGVVVQKSSFGRFGGAAILNAGSVEGKPEGNANPYYEYAADIYNTAPELVPGMVYDDIYYTVESEYKNKFKGLLQANVYVDAESAQSFTNYVTGTESYFTAVGAAPFFSQSGPLPAYNGFFNLMGNAIQFTENGHTVYNIMSLNFNGDGYLTAKTKEWYGNILMNYDDPTKISKTSCADPTAVNPMDPSTYTPWFLYQQLGMQAPLFYTEKGEICTCLYNPLADDDHQILPKDYVGLIKKMVTIDSVLTFNSSHNPMDLVQPAAFTGNILSIMLPVTQANPENGDTTIGGTFEIRPYAAA